MINVLDINNENFVKKVARLAQKDLSICGLNVNLTISHT